MIWLTSDTHFFHKGIVSWGKRPWKHSDFCTFILGNNDSCNCDVVARMNQGLIDNWNSRVKPDDTIFHLGDFAFQPNKQKEGIKEIVKQLNGNIKVAKGNHDKVRQLIEFGIKEENIFEKDYIIIDGIKFLINHFSFPAGMKEDDKTERPYCWIPEEHENGEVIRLLHGHVHWSYMLSKNSLNVGCDVHNWFPISADRVLEIYKDTDGFTNNFEKYNV